MIYQKFTEIANHLEKGSRKRLFFPCPLLHKYEWHSNTVIKQKVELKEGVFLYTHTPTPWDKLIYTGSWPKVQTDSKSNRDKLTEERSKKDYLITFPMQLLVQEVYKTKGCRQLEEYPKVSHCLVLVPVSGCGVFFMSETKRWILGLTEHSCSARSRMFATQQRDEGFMSICRNAR